ncbi:MAG: hypothetical protein K2N94_05380 [Lachnospiraceae bacterium]|nr:hypothetical protein [Lachnospiraceae bacterium]
MKTVHSIIKAGRCSAQPAGLSCRRRTRQQSRREAMDRITLGECLHLYCVLGWTADIRAGHLTALKKEEGGV